MLIGSYHILKATVLQRTVITSLLFVVLGSTNLFGQKSFEAWKEYSFYSIVFEHDMWAENAGGFQHLFREDDWHHVELTAQFLEQEAGEERILAPNYDDWPQSAKTSPHRVLFIKISTDGSYPPPNLPQLQYGSIGKSLTTWRFSDLNTLMRARFDETENSYFAIEKYDHACGIIKRDHKKIQKKWEADHSDDVFEYSEEAMSAVDFDYNPELSYQSLIESYLDNNDVAITLGSAARNLQDSRDLHEPPIRFRQSLESSAIHSVAVMPMESLDCSKNKTSATDESLLVEQELIGLYTVVDRGHLDMILAEQRLAMTGLIMEEGALAKAGCLAGAQGTTIVTRGCLLDNDILTIKMIDCSTSVTYWVASGPADRVYDIMDEIRSQLR